jgi:hypothetical protein
VFTVHLNVLFVNPFCVYVFKFMEETLNKLNLHTRFSASIFQSSSCMITTGDLGLMMCDPITVVN